MQMEKQVVQVSFIKKNYNGMCKKIKKNILIHAHKYTTHTEQTTTKLCVCFWER